MARKTISQKPAPKYPPMLRLTMKLKSHRCIQSVLNALYSGYCSMNRTAGEEPESRKALEWWALSQRRFYTLHMAWLKAIPTGKFRHLRLCLDKIDPQGDSKLANLYLTTRGERDQPYRIPPARPRHDTVPANDPDLFKCYTRPTRTHKPVAPPKSDWKPMTQQELRDKVAQVARQHRGDPTT